MKPVSRLDSASPTLAESFRRASPAKREKAVLVACEMAVHSAELQSQDIVLALDVLRGRAAEPPGLWRRIEDIAAHFDQEYLRLWEEGDEEQDESKKLEALRLLSKTSATSALAFALSEDPALLHEAIYETIEAFDDPCEIIRAVECELR
ncbi:hypothetical protein WMF26_48025 [Sorangium sp. So ce185]|uniref:hypothetical protein n=1 Tax=Sorangium sp. So ce185 TaxID=3133287 RepID=UPI003F60ACF9